ncbi:MAG: carbohydrate ABC transporter permease [Paenibacillaceae bacterium]|nr:carbohydrate ABC transporter permease [Paenibacillaceae bacterium]
MKTNEAALPARRRSSWRRSGWPDRGFDIVVYGLVSLAIAVTLYPFVYVFSMSISDPASASSGEVWLLPKGFSLSAFNAIVHENGIWRAYLNTILYAVVGTVLTLVVTLLAAYPLARKEFVLKKPLMTVLLITMFISGGLIPSFIVINKLGLYDTMWAIILPGLVSAWNVILVKTYIQNTIPEELIEASRMDGLNDVSILSKVVLPLSAPIVAVIALYTAVGYWNSYFSVMVYMPSAEKQTLQIYLMRVLVQNSNDLTQANAFFNPGQFIASIQLKYALIIFVVTPIILIYPFLQKYFIKGVLVGSLKG